MEQVLGVLIIVQCGHKYVMLQSDSSFLMYLVSNFYFKNDNIFFICIGVEEHNVAD